MSDYYFPLYNIKGGRSPFPHGEPFWRHHKPQSNTSRIWNRLKSFHRANKPPTKEEVLTRAREIARKNKHTNHES